MAESKNRLASSSSPYLQQHADNPVDWYPWGNEALEKSIREDKPILLSIGYSACHWCHVMAHESFEDPDTAALMNRHFVNIKVDREERPDVDALYMEALQRLTGSGGWPMTLFLTPEREPFYGGTYFPPSRRGRMPAFTEVLASVAQTWQERRSEVLDFGRQMRANLGQQGTIEDAVAGSPEARLLKASLALMPQIDRTEGGFGHSPKFPQPNLLAFMLQQSALNPDAETARFFKDALGLTLKKMAMGGIHDQLGGGFHRYSTDRNWLVPHFEKMLYDNALLAGVYLKAWQAYGEPRFAQAARSSLDFMLKELLAAEGGFYSALDADSEGQEGKYYVWTLDEINEALGEERGGAFASAFGLTEQGNFEESGHAWNVLHQVSETASPEGFAEEIALLRRFRESRTRPARDEKILAEWNGFALQAFSEAAFILDEPLYLQTAENLAEYLEAGHTWLDGDGLRRVSRLPFKQITEESQGFLEDYAALGLGFLALHQVSLDERWLALAEALANSILTLFSDGASPGFFQTASDAERLIVRRKESTDSVIPSGNSMAHLLLWRLGLITGDEAWQQLAKDWLQSLGADPGLYPTAFGQTLQLLQEIERNPYELELQGPIESSFLQDFLGLLRRRYLPGLVIKRASPDEEPAVTLCAEGTCYPPVKTIKDFEKLLKLQDERQEKQ